MIIIHCLFWTFFVSGAVSAIFNLIDIADQLTFLPETTKIVRAVARLQIWGKFMLKLFILLVVIAYYLGCVIYG